jgi:hypothetical protein
MVWYVTCKREINSQKTFIRKPEGKRPLGRSGHRWEGKGVDWIHLVQDSCQWQTLVNMVINLWVPQKKHGYFLTTQVTISFSGKTLLHGWR